MDQFLVGLSNLFEIKILLIIMVGTIAGIIIGALPGFTPTMGVALLIPFTFAMTPVNGLALLGAVYTGSVYGGSISAILLNIPGAPANIATIFDGHPMAAKGEGQKALATSVISSFHGGVAGVIVLLLFAPPLVKLALQFGPAENFWVAIFGLTIIASLGTSRELIKGLLGGAIGVLISIVGISPTTGAARFTFDSPYLTGGVSLIPALIGLFAFSQALVYFEKLQQGQTISVNRRKGVFWSTWKEIITRYPGISLFSSALGSVIGIVPGAGGQVAGIIAYDQAKRFSKERDKFGHGATDGVVAPETANNATVGGSMVPLLTLGIPGSPTAAVLLGGLLIHGLWPGPDLFTKNGEITYTFIAALLAAQFFMLFFGGWGSIYAVHVLKTPQYFSGPAIITLCMFGAFAVQNNIVDIYIMLALGVLGYIGLKIGISPAPVVLGLILGPIAENGLLLGVRLGEAQGSVLNYFFTRPISIILILVILAAVVSTFLLELKRSRKERLFSAQTSTPAPKGFLTMDSLMGLGFIAFGLFTWAFYVSKLPRESGILATVILFVMAGLGAILFFQGWRVGSEAFKPIPLKMITEVVVISVALFVLAGLLGFYSATLVFALFMPVRMLFKVGKEIKTRTLISVAAFGIGMVVLLYAAFGAFLSVPTPRGILF